MSYRINRLDINKTNLTNRNKSINKINKFERILKSDKKSVLTISTFVKKINY